MPECRVVIAVSNAVFAKKLKALVQSNGYLVIDEATSSADCMRKIRASMPDVLIIGMSLAGISTYPLIKVLLGEKITSVVVLASDNVTTDGFFEFKGRLDFEIINAPINTGVLLNTLYMIHKSSIRLRDLEKKLTELENSLETRKVLDKAKGLLMKNYKVEEKEAHRRIQKTAMDTGMTLREVANLVIEKYS
jgi:response regulator NasT